MKHLIVCALAGAVVAQIWGSFSWMVLPWHNLDHRKFANETEVMEVIRNNTSEAGLYTLPVMHPDAEDHAAAMQEWDEKAQAGPYLFATVHPNGIPGGMAVPMARGFALNFIIAALLCWMMTNLKITCPKGRTIMIASSAMAGSLYPIVSNWNWWKFPVAYTVSGFVDIFVTWAFAGFVMVKLYDKFSKKAENAEA